MLTNRIFGVCRESDSSSVSGGLSRAVGNPPRRMIINLRDLN